MHLSTKRDTAEQIRAFSGHVKPGRAQ